ncbi:MAG: 4Fe-4S dicluster domain-containing protein [Bacteroidetes bacterium]|nr:4Fe-4S dicluster domain-containing protein [Bacteroidota bacterium]MBU1677840.1 4Fe-4S dicluster domain-containing protein [Bacteroidota bacterium]MBU2506513.1 4Fe-4S dicluster domain-containing protein [Bacteroidota bacterium]
MERRTFVKTLGAIGLSTLPTITKGAESKSSPGEEFNAILIDTTLCTGCRTCEEVCLEANGMQEFEMNDSDLEKERDTSTDQLTLINLYENEENEIYVKKQCMHCSQPACASACLTKAMLKTKEGPVIWREDKCMGCRFCMLSCPFDVPKFEYHSANPKIVKCTMCFERQQKGGLPACVENCPSEAIIFGKRTELLTEAKRRIAESPDDYVNHIYGEHEAGGTCVLYLSSVPFEEINFRTNLGNDAYPELTTGFLYSVPLVIILWPPFLLAMRNAMKGKVNNAEEVENE